MAEVNIEQLRDEVAAALAEVLARHECSMVTRWVAVVETVEAADGERGLWCLAPEDAKKWDTLGMLSYALSIEQANTVADTLDDR